MAGEDARGYEAYLWAYFTGDVSGGERISFAVSKGNDALRWHVLNHGHAVLSSHCGTRGLRDPFIMRSHDGSRFYLMATDLCVAAVGGDFGYAQCKGSRYLEIWQSSDLVHWGEQQHVRVSSQAAGNTWAPEAHWVEELDQYVLYWASNLYVHGDDSRSRPTYNRTMMATTRDFRTFGEPQVWVDVPRGNGHDGRGTIDATLAREGKRWYRFIKDERTMQVREEWSDDVMATVSGALPEHGEPTDGHWSTGGGWHMITDCVGVGLPNGEYAANGEPQLFTQGEGPCIFQANPGDVNGYRWFLFIDQPRYHAGPGHYIGFATHDLADARGWRPVSDKLRRGLPVGVNGGKPRHGTVMPITKNELDRLIDCFG